MWGGALRCSVLAALDSKVVISSILSLTLLRLLSGDERHSTLFYY